MFFLQTPPLQNHTNFSIQAIDTDFLSRIAVTSGSLTQDVTTVNCALLGGTRATQAICTGASAVQGLGNGTQTTTLASSQLNYVPVTVTAGVENMNAVSHSPSSPSGSSGGTSGGGGSGSATSSAGAAVATVVRYAVGVVVRL